MPLRMVACLAVLAPRVASAEVPRLDLADGVQTVHVGAGLEHAFVVEIGYARAIGPAVLDASFAVPWAELDVADFQLRAGVARPIGRAGCWRAFARIAPTLRGTHNDVARLFGVGFDASLVGGYHGSRWFATLEAGADLTLATHAAHTDAYRAKVYDDVVDGWYATYAGMLRAGVQLGVTVGHTDIVLRAGRPFLANGDPSLIPFYATLGAGRRW